MATQRELKEAHRVLEPVFVECRARFVQAGLGRVAQVKGFVRDGFRRKDRHFGSCRTDGLEIWLAPEAARLPMRNIRGIVAHEMGHAADFLYPGFFRGGAFGPPPSREELRAFHARGRDAEERAADEIASRVMGFVIGYDGDMLLQCAGCGVSPRPAGLR